jgi:hypothetical protein
MAIALQLLGFGVRVYGEVISSISNFVKPLRSFSIQQTCLLSEAHECVGFLAGLVVLVATDIQQVMVTGNQVYQMTYLSTV